MARYHHGPIGELAHQLKLSPVRLRLKQLDAAEHLIDIIEHDKSYPYEFVCHLVTGHRPRKPTQYRPMPGRTLSADLVQFVEDLSAHSPLPVEMIPMGAWTTEDLAKRLSVSTKTITRWRKRGLVGRKLRYPDGSVRMAFLDRSLRRFVWKNRELVKRGAAFKQLTVQEKERIVLLARELLSEKRMRLHELSQQIAARIGRAVETVRYTLRRFDRAHPEEALFGKDDQPAVRPELHMIYDAVRAGEDPAEVGKAYGRSAEAVMAVVREVRARLLAAREIFYIFNAEFASPAADEAILRTDPGATERKMIRPPRDLPPYLQDLYRHPLFTPEQERSIFRRYNYLKYRADQARRRIDPLSPDESLMDSVDSLLADAENVKNEILRANLRLVVSIARRHVGRSPHFFEVVSDGNLSLMRAVEKFDYARGYKFSTYASWAVMRNFARSIPEQMYHSAKLVTGVDELLSAAPSHEIAAEGDNDGLRALISKGLDLLTDRERDVVVRHYGLTKDAAPMTLDQIGRIFGVTKERIRQIERRALSKLKESLGAYRDDFAAE